MIKKVIGLLFTIVFLQSCNAFTYPVDENIDDGSTPTVTFGSTCYISSCYDCGKNSCPISGQDLIGAPCSCNTRNGSQAGVVGR
jgi:hypothetical protein